MPSSLSPLSSQPGVGKSALPAFSKNLLGFFVEVVRVVLISVAIIVPVRYFLIQPFYVKGASMEPTFHDDEYLVIDELSYRFRAPQRGEVVVLKNPRGGRDFYIKRIIGLPGERISIQSGQVRITNAAYPTGFVLDETAYLASSIRTHGDIEEELGPNDYYLLGDNRAASLDSRSFGSIAKQEIVGRTWVRVWPLKKATVFSVPQYNQATP